MQWGKKWKARTDVKTKKGLETVDVGTYQGTDSGQQTAVPIRKNTEAKRGPQA